MCEEHESVTRASYRIEERERAASKQVGTPEQWARVNREGGARADAARRNAAQCGTDPSWYGF